VWALIQCVLVCACTRTCWSGTVRRGLPCLVCLAHGLLALADAAADAALHALESKLWQEKGRKSFDRAWLPFSLLAISFTLARFVFQVRSTAPGRSSCPR
jgi:hypothetical protein